jgi:hypothetical protein
MAQPTWAFRSGNPIPGNHGHPVTQPSVLLVGGGHPVVDEEPQSVGGETVYDPGTRPFAPPAGGPGNLSIAPTVAGLFGIGEPAGGYDGSPLAAAFEDYAFLPHRPCEAATPPPDLAVDISDQPDPVRKNDPMTLTVDVGNRGSSGATGVTLQTRLPDALRLRTVRSSAGTCTVAGRTVNCSLGALGAGESATVTIEARADRVGVATTTSSAQGAEAEVDRANNEATETTAVIPR